MFIILFIAFDASLFLKNELISDRKFVSLTLSIGFVTVIFYFLKLLIFCYLQKNPMLFLHHFFKKYNLRNLNYINSKAAQIIIKKLIAGAIVTGITKDALKSLPIPVPPLSKQQEIADHITGIRQQAQQLKDKTSELLKQASEEIENILLG
jgi:restriction endonuclease S subunit